MARSSRIQIGGPRTALATSISALLVVAPPSPGATYTVDLGDSLVVSTAVSGSLIKSGLGTLTLTGPQTYTGVTSVRGGALVVSAASLPSSSPITVYGSSAQGATGGQLVLAGSLTPQTFAFSAPSLGLIGAGPGGDGVALLNIGNNTLTGGIATSSTTATALGSAFGTATITSLNLGTGQSVSVQGNFNTSIGSLTGAGTLSKSGTGTLLLTGNNSYSGILSIAAGSVRVSSAGNLGTSTASTAVTLAGGALDIRAAQTNFGSKAVSISSTSGTINVGRDTSGSGIAQTVTFGNLTLGPNGNLIVNGRNGYGLQFGTGLGGGAGHATLQNTGNGPLVFVGNVWGTTDSAARSFFFSTPSTSGDITVNGSVLASGAAHSIVKSNAGTLNLFGTASTVTGVTDIQNGTIVARNFNSLGATTSAANILLGNGANTGTLTFSGVAGSGAVGSSARPLVFNGTTGGARINASQTGSAATAVLLTGSISAPNANAKLLTLGGMSTLNNEIAGAIPNAGSALLSVTKTDPGTWVLSGANTYGGATTIQNGTLRLRANAASSTVLSDSSAITFAIGTAQEAGGTLEFLGQSGVANVETLGTLTANAGANTVKVTPGGSGGTASLIFSSLGGASSLGHSINFVAPTALDLITLQGQPTGFVRAAAYYNGADFAYADSGGVLRAPVYGSDGGFAAASSAALAASAHNAINGSFTTGAMTINSLKIAGGHTLSLSGPLAIGAAGVSGGILVSGGAATITGSSVLQNGTSGGLVIRVDGSGDQLTLESPISSAAGGLTKNGAGTLILTSASNNNLSTIINEGTLKLSGSAVLSAANSSTVVRDGATLDLNGVSTGTRIGLFNGAGTVTNSGTAAATLTLGNNNQAGTFSGVIQDGTGQISVVKVGTANPTWSGLSTYTGSTTIQSTGLISIPFLSNIGSPSGIGSGSGASDAANAASLVFAGSGGGINYTGTSSVAIDRLFTLGGTTSSAGARINANGSNNATLIFTKTNPIAYVGGASNVAQTLTLGGSSTGDNEMRLHLSDPAGIPTATLSVTKADAGLWVLGNAANTYTGRTTISAGTLVANDGTSLPTASGVVMAGGILQGTGTIARAVVSANPGAGQLSWNAGSAGGFAAHHGDLTVALGPQVWGANGFLTTNGTSNQALTLNSPTALAVVRYAGDIDLGAATRTITVNDNTTTSTDYAIVSGAISGSGGLIKGGNGLLVLSGANSYSGPSTLSSGSLYLSTIGASTSASSGLGSGVSTFTHAGGLLGYVGSGETSDRAITQTATGVLDASGSGPLVLSALANSTSTGSRTLTIQGLNTDANKIASVLANGGGTSTFGVTKSGGGTWILEANNTYSGNTTFSAGNLGAGSNNAFGTGTLVFSSGNLFAAGGPRTLANPITFSSSAGFIGTHSLTLAGPVTQNSSTILQNFLDPGKTLEFSNAITSNVTSTSTVTHSGTGRTVFSGMLNDNPGTSAAALALTVTGGTAVLASPTGNNYAGNTQINGGTLQLAGGSGDLIRNGAGKGNVIFGNTTVPAVFDLSGQTETINGLTGTSTGTKTIDNVAGSAASLTIGDNGGAVNYNGGIANTGGGPLSLTKVGSAAGTLSGTAMNFTGTLSIVGGSLAFTGADPASVSGISVAGGSGLSLLNGTGTPLTGLGTLSLGAGSGITTLGLNLGTTSDRLATGGSALTANAVSFNLVGVGGFGAGTYNLLSATGGGLDGATYSLGSIPGGYSFSLNATETSVDVTATVLGAGTYFWSNALSGSWSAYSAGSTNWAQPGGTDAGAAPGPLDVVVFSSPDVGTLPVGPAIPTTLDGNFTIDSLQFNGRTGGASAAASVSITPGTGGTLTIAPALSSDGIEVADGSGTASISAPVVVGADQTWSVGSIGSPRPLLTVSGVMSGTGNLTKLGAGTASILGINTWTGRTTIAAGTVNLIREESLGANPASPTSDQLTLDGGTLRYGASFNINDPNRGILITAAGGTIDMGSSGTIASNLSGPGLLTKISAGTLTLMGANSYVGGTRNTSGTIIAGHNSALGPGTVMMENSTGLDLRNGVTLANAIDITDVGTTKTLRLQNGAAAATFSGPINVTESSLNNFVINADAGGTLTISGPLTVVSPSTSHAGIRKTGAGTLLLTNPGSTIFGGARIDGGTLRYGATDLLPSTSAVSIIGTSSTAATLDLNGFNQTVGSLTFGGSGASRASSHTLLTGAGTLTLGGNVTVSNSGNPATPALLSGNVTFPATRFFAVSDSTGSVVDLLVSAAISGAGSVTKNGAGTMALSGANTYTGNTTVNAGTLRNAAHEVIPGVMLVNANATNSSATYDLNGFNETVSTLTFSSTGSTIANTTNSVTTGAGTLTLDGDVTSHAGATTTQAILNGFVALPATRTFTVADATARPVDLTLSASVSGSGGLTKTGAGTLQLGGANTYSGDTTLSAGAVQLAGTSGNAIPHGAGKGNVIFDNASGTVLLDLNGRSETINGLIGTTAGAKLIDNTSSSAAALTFGSNNAPVDFNGDITNSGFGPLSLVKTGTAAGTLSGSTLSYTGTTTVEAGGSLSFPNAAPTATTGITIAGGATFNLQNGEGTPISGLTLLDLGGGAGTTRLALDLGPNFDFLIATGSATTANTIIFDLAALVGFGPGTYPLLAAPGGGLLGATYMLGNVPSGFNFVLNQNATLISLTANAPTAPFFYWRGDQGSSWSAFNVGNTNWDDAAGADFGSLPGAGATVTFSSVLNPPGAPVATTLDGDFTIDSLRFNGSNSGTAASAVSIAAGAPGTSTLTIAPVSSADGILISDSGGTASISAGVNIASDQSWTVSPAGSPTPRLTVSGPLSGAGQLTKMGQGVVDLSSTTSTWSGKLVLNQGTIGISSEAALGPNPSTATPDQLTFNGGTLRFNAPTLLDDANRGITVLGSGGKFDTSAASGTVESAVVISGPGVLTKIGAGTLTLLGANTYEGGTQIEAGTVLAGHALALGTGAANLTGTGAAIELRDGVDFASAVIVSDNGNQKTLGLETGATSATFSGPVSIAETTNGNFRVRAGAGGALTFSGVIAQTGTASAGLRKEGAGAVILSNPGNALRGTTTIVDGTLMHGASGVLPSTSSVTVNAAGNMTATLDLAGFDQTVSSLTFNGTGGAAGSVNRVLTGAGTLTLNGSVSVSNSGNPTTTPIIAGNLRLNGLRTFSVADSTGSVADLEVSASIANVSTAGGIVKSNTGTLVLSGENSFTSGVSFSSAGAIRAAHANALGTGTATLGTTGAILELADGITVGNAITISDSGNEKTLRLLSGASAGTFAGPVTVSESSAGNFRVAAFSGGTLNFTGTITTTGTVQSGIRKEGDGVVMLSNSLNAIRGGTTVVGGTLRLGASGALVSTTAVAIQAAGAASATLDLNGFDQTIGALSFNGTAGSGAIVNALHTGAGTLTLGGDVTVSSAGNPTTPALLAGQVAIGADRNFTVQDSTGSVADLLVSAAIGSVGTTASGIVKSGAGTLDLGGANTFTGLTTVNAGALRNAANNVIPGALVVNATSDASTAAYDLNGFNETLPALRLGGSTAADTLHVVKTSGGVLTLAGDVTTLAASVTSQASLQGLVNLPATTTFNVADANGFDWGIDLSIAAAMSGSGGLIKAGPGTMELSGANSYAGPTTVREGLLLMGANDAIPGAVVLDAQASSAAAVLDFNGTNQTLGDVTFGGSTAPGATNIIATEGGLLTLGGNVTRIAGGSGAWASILGYVHLPVVRTFTVADTPGMSIDLDVTAEVLGSGGVVKEGVGTLALNAANAFTGKTTVNAGTLLITNDASLGAVPASPVADQLTLAGGSTLLPWDTTTLAANRGVSLPSGTAALNVRSGNTLTAAGVVSGAGSLEKIGSGTLTLAGANIYSGKTIVSAGRLLVSADANLGAAPGALVADQLTLRGGTLVATTSFSTDANRGVSVGTSGAAIEVAAASTLTMAAPVSGTGPLVKQGSGTLALGGTAANTHTGTLLVSGGTLALAKSAGVNAIVGDGLASTAAADLAVIGGAVRLDGHHQIDDTVSINLVSGSFNFNDRDEVLHSFVHSGGAVNYGLGAVVIRNGQWTGATNSIVGTTTFGRLTITGGTNSAASGAVLEIGTTGFEGPIEFAGANNTPTLQLTSHNTLPGRLRFAPGTSSGLVFSGTGTSSGLISSTGSGSLPGEIDLNGVTRTFHIGDAAGADVDMLIGANIVEGSAAAGLTKTGAGTLRLSAANTFTGPTTLAGGKLRVAAENNLGATPASPVANQLTFDGGTLQTTTTLALNANRGVTLAAGGGALDVASGTTLTLPAVITGSGSLAKAGTGTLVLSGANTHLGATTIQEGTVELHGGQAIHDDAAVFLADAASALLRLHTNETLGSLAGGGALGGNVNLQSFALTVGNASDSTYAGVISGTGTLIKQGSGTLYLTGTNTYTGFTTILGGTLVATNLPGGIGVFGPGTTYGGTGSGGNVTVGSAAVLAPGSSPGVLTLDSLHLNAGSQLHYELGAPNITLTNPATSDATVITTPNGFTFDGANFQLTGLTGLTTALYHLIQYNGALGGSFSNITLSSDIVTDPAGHAFYAFLKNTPGFVDLETTNQMVWHGDGAGNVWNSGVAGAANWKSTAPVRTGLTFRDTMVAIFDDTLGAGNSTITIAGTVAPSAINVSGTTNYVFTGSGSIAGEAGIAKSGESTLELTGSGANSFTGVSTISGGLLKLNKPAGTTAISGDAVLSKTVADVVVNGGTLQLAQSHQLGDGVSIAVSAGTLDFNGRDETLWDLRNSGGVIHYGTGRVIVVDPEWSGGSNHITGYTTFGSLTISGGTNTVFGTAGGGPGLLEIGTSSVAGPLEFSGANNTPTLTLDADNTTPGRLRFAAGVNAPLVFSGTGSSSGLIAAGAAGAVSPVVDLNGATRTFDIGDAAASDVDMTIAVPLIEGTAAAGLHKTGAGTLHLSTANTFTGGTTIGGGRLRMASEDRLGPAPGSFVANQLTLDGGGLQTGSTFTMSGNRGVTLGAAGGSLEPASATTLTIPAAIVGSGALTKDGAGALVLLGANTYGGATTVNAGTLRNGVADIIPGSLRVDATAHSSTAAYDLNGFDETVSGLTLGGSTATGATNLVTTGSGTLTLGGDVTTLAGSGSSAAILRGNIQLPADRTFLVADTSPSAVDLLIEGVLSQVGAFLKIGAGTVSFSGPNANTYSGATTVQAGTLLLDKPAGADAIRGDGIASKATSDLVVDGGTVRLLASNQLHDTVRISVLSGLLDFNGASETLYDLAASGGTVNYGTGTITVTDPVWSGAANEVHGETIFGNLFVSAGLNTIFGSAGPGGGPGRLTIGVTGVEGPLEFTGHDVSPSIVLNSDAGTPGRLRFAAGLNVGVVFSGTGSAAASIVSAGAAANAGELDLNGSTRTFAIADAAGSDVDMSISAKVVDSAASGAGITKTGAGTLQLSGANTFTGKTAITGGALRISAEGNLGVAPGSPVSDQLSLNGGTLQTTATFAMSSHRGVTVGAGGGTFATSASTTLTVPASIGGVGALTKTGGGTLLISGANSYAGSTAILGGTLTLAGGNAVPNASAVSVADQAGAALRLNASETIGRLSGGGGAGGDAQLQNFQLTVTSHAEDTFAGDISGVGGSLSLTGTGTLTLDPRTTNTFSGATSIGADTTLVAQGAGALGGTSGVTVNAGGTFLLAGANGDNRVNDSAGLTLSGGVFDAAGLSETFGVLTLTADSIIDFGHGASILSFANSSAANWGEFTLSIYNWSGTTTTGGGMDQLRFAGNGLSESQLAQILFYSDAGLTELALPLYVGNDFVGGEGEVVPVPEASAVLMGLALLGLAGWRERSSSHARRRQRRVAGPTSA